MRYHLLLTAFAISSLASADTFSDFGSGDDGWLAVNVAFPSLDVLNTWSPTWTGSTINASEQGSGLFVLAAPAKFRGNQMNFLGGTVTFQLSDSVVDGIAYPNLLLRGNGTILYFETPAPGPSLTSYSVNLNPTGWKNATGVAASQSEFNSVFSNLDVFAINADWKTGGIDYVELDNVRISAPVPEPATLGTLAFGVLCLRRRRSKVPTSEGS